ncbi:MAG TPA: SGNH/GDSL hydrolase family protein [Ignavibacteriaceae bacterium]|nr:SGNH/GDSL hydrolase family protein [Ignavibacteriaceae bacterium]
MKEIIKKIIRTIFFLFIIVVFFELFLRFTEISLPSYVYDSPKFGRIQKPGADYFSILGEGFGMGKVNKFGYLGPAYPKNKDKEVIRIALVGDSYVEGNYLFDRQHYRYLLEKKLSMLIDKKVEVLNFGVGGYNLRDIYINFKKRVLEYNPNIVIIFIREGNFLQKDANPGPNLELKNGSLKIEYKYKNTKQYKLRMEFQLLREYSIGNLIKETYEEYSRKNYGKLLFGKLYSIFHPSNNLASNNSDSSNVIDKYYSINKVILEKLSEYNNSPIKIFIAKSNNYPVYYDNLISKYHLSTIDLDSLLYKYSKGTEILNYWKASGETGHWNHKAQRIIGNYLANYIYNYFYKKK